MKVAPYADRYFAGIKAPWEGAFPDDPPRNSADMAVPAKVSEHPELFWWRSTQIA